MAALDPSLNPTTTTTANDVYLAGAIFPTVLDEARPYAGILRSDFRYSGPEKAPAVFFPVMAKPAAATSNYTEGTGLANAALSTDKATATALSNGQMATITDELDEIAIMAAVPYFSGVLGRSVEEEFQTVATALLAAFASTSGTAGNATSYADLLDGVNKLAQRDQAGVAIGILDPSQAGNVRIDLGTSGAAALANTNGPISNAVLQEPMGAELMGWNGLAGASTWRQTSVVTSTGGGVFMQGQAIGLYEIRPPRLETIRVPNLPATECVYTSRYGVIEVRDLSGQTFLGN